MDVVYHRVPKDMVGDTIYPLNQLRDIAAQAYEFQKAKYAGREAGLDFHLEALGGTLQIASMPDNGTTLRATVPVPHPVLGASGAP